MLQFWFSAISYLALVFLFMPKQLPGVIAAAVIFVGGMILITKKKVYKVPTYKVRYALLVPAAFFLCGSSGQLFFERWFDAAAVEKVASILHMTPFTVVLPSTVVVSLLSVYVTYFILQAIVDLPAKFSQRASFLWTLFWFGAISIITVICAQLMIDVDPALMGRRQFLWCNFIVFTAIFTVYALSGRAALSAFLGAGIFMLISTVNVYIYMFRGRLFEPVDLFSVRTAMNVVGNYSLLPIPANTLNGWGILITGIVILFYINRGKKRPALKKRLVLLAGCAAAIAVITFYAIGLKTYHWKADGAKFNGYIADFVSKIKEISPEKPANYSADRIAELSAQYQQDGIPAETEQKKPPHILVIMNEAFSDLSVLGDFSTNTEVTPFISSLKENTVSGYALSSVYGGNTANSEYEFLTGNTMAWLAPSVVPYQQYMRSSAYSMVSYLKSAYDYRCIAMHPYHANGWNRPSAYGYLGFDTCYFEEAFPQENIIREYVSDQEMFDVLIETYEAQKEDPLFVLGITMQNHGGYDLHWENYTNSIHLEEYADAFPEEEQYLSLLHDTDLAVENLISYFENADENVVIVFFGDHQPKLTEAFYQAVGGAESDALDDIQKRYVVPFFIWANYDIEEAQLDCTSLNYLSSYVYDAAGIPLPSYNRFLKELEKVIPAINANGYYSPASGGYLPFSAATGEERQWLDLYEELQYNCLFDRKNRDASLFPVLD